MLHEPAAPSGRDPAFAYKKRLGAWMFLIYSVVYAAFVAMNLLSPGLMEAIVAGGVDLAVVYGFGLIALALILALIYTALCSHREAALRSGKQGS